MEDVTHRGISNCHAETLLNRSVLKVIEFLPSLIEDISTLPVNLKERILYLMQKRGLVVDQNIAQALYDRVSTLDLSECDVTDMSLNVIGSTCHMLRSIDLNAAKSSRPSITSQGVVSLAHGCPYLKVVYLRRCINIDDDAIMALAQCCPQLRDLNIGGCPQITDASLHAVGEHSQLLASIDFSHSNVTDDGIFSLVRGTCCDTLKEVHMNSCNHLTDEAVEAIVHFCPNIAILIFHSCRNITDRSRVALGNMLGSGGGSSSRMTQLTWTVY
jgi:hypothetical protein